ncbi:MAG: DUF998 domain-containing protein [Azoarcus sp.]|jgi:hypothetical protein|nr:DUF998 domain-containing protein [Azoarcus sp.]
MPPQIKLRSKSCLYTKDPDCPVFLSGIGIIMDKLKALRAASSGSAGLRAVLEPRMLAAAACCGVAIFLLTVLALHVAQPGHDPRAQFMSELALGPWGEWMILAFAGLGLAAAATGLSIHARAASRVLPRLPGILLALAAILFLAAGFVTLAVSAQAHIVFIAGAFIACGVAMYLLPRVVAVFAGPGGYVFSWGSGLVMCGAVALGDRLIPPGVSQRIAACALLFWLLYVARKLARRPAQGSGVSGKRSPAP